MAEAVRGFYAAQRASSAWAMTMLSPQWMAVPQSANDIDPDMTSIQT